MPGSPGTMAGPFRWVVLAQGFSSLAFWATFGTMFAEATNRFHATSSEMAVLGAALSVPFILGSLLQGLVVDRWSPKWTAVIGYSMQFAAIPVAFAAPSLPWIWAAAFVVGGAFATIEPARSALTSLLVPEDRLVRANGTLATAFQLALVVGSLAGGWLLDAWNADAVYAAGGRGGPAPGALHADGPRRAPARRAPRRVVRRPAPRRADGLAPPDLADPADRHGGRMDPRERLLRAGAAVRARRPAAAGERPAVPVGRPRAGRPRRGDRDHARPQHRWPRGADGLRGRRARGRGHRRLHRGRPLPGGARGERGLRGRVRAVLPAAPRPDPARDPRGPARACHERVRRAPGDGRARELARPARLRRDRRRPAHAGGLGAVLTPIGAMGLRAVARSTPEAARDRTAA